jgi:hypothetical protein
MSTGHGSTAHAAATKFTTVVSWSCVYDLRTTSVGVSVLVATRWSGGSATHGVLVFCNWDECGGVVSVWDVSV